MENCILHPKINKVKNLKYLVPIFTLVLFFVSSCNNDDEGDDNFIPARDRSVEVIDSTLAVSYTHLTLPTTPYV